MSSGLTEESAKFATIGIGCIMVSHLDFKAMHNLLVHPFRILISNSYINRLL